MIEMFCILIVMMITHGCICPGRIHLTVYFKLVHFILCRLCINQLSLKMWLEKFIGAVSKGLDGENTPSSIWKPQEEKRPCLYCSA